MVSVARDSRSAMKDQPLVGHSWLCMACKASFPAAEIELTRNPFSCSCMQIFCIFLFIAGSSIFGTLLSEVRHVKSAPGVACLTALL